MAGEGCGEEKAWGAEGANRAVFALLAVSYQFGAILTEVVLHKSVPSLTGKAGGVITAKLAVTHYLGAE